MKKKLLFLIVATFALTLQAHQIIDLRTGDLSSDSLLTSPQRNIEYVSDGIIVTYKIDKIAIFKDDLYPNTYRVDIPGFSDCDSVAMPSIVSAVRFYILPKGTIPTLTLLSSKHVDLHYELAPSREPKTSKDTVPYSIENVPPIDAYTGYWPQNVCESLPTGSYRGQPIAKVSVNPIHYNYNSKTIRAYSEIKYKITLPTGASMNDVYYEPLSMLNPNCTLMPQAGNGPRLFSLQPPGSSINATTSYIIVSVPQFKETLQEFVKWKKRLGYNIIEMYDDNWTSEKIKSKVHNYYKNDSTLMYLLLIGDHALVPATLYGSAENGYISDYQYACLDWDTDTDPDLYSGRWPVRNIAELQTIIDKTIWYEQIPISEEQFYRKGAHFSLFEDGSKGGIHDGIEDSRKVKTSEDARNYLFSNYNMDISRLYHYYIDESKYDFEFWPEKWNSFYCGSSDLDLPNELLFKNGFRWDATANDLIREINNGVCYVFHTGHGINFAWGNEKYSTLTIPDVLNMRNYDRLPLVFSTSCLSGNHKEQDCITTSFLTNEYGGAIALIANTGSASYTSLGKRSSLFFNAIWSTPGLLMNGYDCQISSYLEITIEEAPICRQLGAIMNYIWYGHVNNKEKNIYDNRIMHCFGDPSLYFHTTVPTEINNVEITETETGVHVLVPNQEAFISFYDPINNRVERRYGTEAVYLTGISGGGKYIDITVYTPESKPYTRFGIPYYGTVESNPKQYGLLNYRDLKNGTVEIDYCLSPQHTSSNTEIQIVEAMTGSIVSSWPIDTSIKNQKVTVAMRCEPEIMVAYMMTNGTPILSIKMYISKY